MIETKNWYNADFVDYLEDWGGAIMLLGGETSDGNIFSVDFGRLIMRNVL